MGQNGQDIQTKRIEALLQKVKKELIFISNLMEIKRLEIHLLVIQIRNPTKEKEFNNLVRFVKMWPKLKIFNLFHSRMRVNFGYLLSKVTFVLIFKFMCSNTT